MSYHYEDPCPGVPLSQIAPIITRAHSWLARVANNLSHSDSIQYGGAIFMLAGMEYHFTSVKKHLVPLAGYIASKATWDTRWAASLEREGSLTERQPEPTANEHEHQAQIAHEAVAYVNRLGQFYAFAKSKSQQHLMTRATELMIFRHKHTAHRSIDAPRSMDNYMSMWSQATSMGGFYSTLRDGAPMFQIPDEQGKWQQFSILADHPALLAECMATLEAIAPLRELDV